MDTNIAEHPRPCAPRSARAIDALVDLAQFGMPGRYERLVLDPSPAGNHVVACLPFFTYGIQFGDHVAVRDDGSFSHVIAASGLRTFRVALKEATAGRLSHERLHERIAVTGLPHERHGADYVAVLLRGHEDQEQVRASLGDLINELECEVDPEPFAP